MAYRSRPVKLSENSKRRMISAVRGFYKFLMFEGHMTLIRPRTSYGRRKVLICRDSSINLRSRCSLRHLTHRPKMGSATGRYWN